MDGAESGFKDCLQQSKKIETYGLTGNEGGVHWRSVVVVAAAAVVVVVVVEHVLSVSARG